MNRSRCLARAARLLRSSPVLASLGIGLLLMLACIHPARATTCSMVTKTYATFYSCTGTLTDGRPFAFRIPIAPAAWNGTVVSMSGGNDTAADLDYYVVGQPVAQWLVQNGYAVAGSAGGDNGWDVEGMMRNELETLDRIQELYPGTPLRTIAYGSSFGGMVSAALVQQHPDRFAGAFSAAGVLAGSIGIWNGALDCAFVIQQLVGAGSGLQVVHITNPGNPSTGNWGLAVQLLNTAQGTPAGRARIALACAMADIPGWYDPLSAEPAPDDYAAQELNQLLWTRDQLTAYMFGPGRAGVEAAAGGNPSWNTDVDYAAQLAKSVDYAEVVALYQAAGLSLQNDLDQLNAAPRIATDPGTIGYMCRNTVFDGDLRGAPILALHTTADGIVVDQQEFAYRSAAVQARDPELLRQVYVHRAGHVALTWAEDIVGFQALFHRLDTGQWGDLSPAALNAAAQALGPTYNVLWINPSLSVPLPPAYFDYDPAAFLRPYDVTPPRLLSVQDVANDEGRQVRLQFHASGADVTGSPTLAQYDLYRQIAALPGQALRPETTRLARTRAGAAPGRIQLDGWDNVGAVPASAETVYSVVVPTLADSNGTGLHLATFFARATITEPAGDLDSAPESGYSVDNLPPAPPSPFTAAYTNGATHLHWGANAEADFANYRLYRGATADFVPGAGNLIATSSDTGYADPGAPGSCYKLSATDLNGNESGFSLVTPTSTANVSPGTPVALFFAAPAPNPAHVGTTLRWGLPRDAAGSLRIYDVNGRRIRDLAGGRLPAGEHALTWDLRDESGNRVASGVFFARLQADRAALRRRIIVEQ